LLKINIEDLTFKCIIGILPNERKKKQKVIIDISFEYFYKDDGVNFMDYSKVVNFVQKTMVNKKFRLIEDAILFIRKKLKKKYDIKNLRVKISKPNILSNCVVSVEE
jgi:dihydroneopterin aldolase